LSNLSISDVSDAFQVLHARRRKWVEANHENGFEEGIKRLLTDLYPDNAHFIYELLQNAEDTGAKEVAFRLFPDRLEFTHDGSRLFSLRDVESITSIGASTKRDDPTSIGKFGVGFKAVFAYTTAPTIQSGPFAFTIRDLVVPERHRDESAPYVQTRFVIPFNHPGKSNKASTQEVARGLQTMGPETLLFLRHIRKIAFTLPDGSMGWL